MKNPDEKFVKMFNDKYPKGSTVLHRKSVFDNYEQRVVRSEAYISSSGAAVAFFEGMSGYYDISDDFVKY